MTRPEVERTDIHVPGGERKETNLLPNERIFTHEEVGLLVAQNYGTYILNEENSDLIFGENAQHFQPNSFDPVRLVWVQITPHSKRLMLQDGHHRTKGVFDHELIARYAESVSRFDFVGRDITEEFLNNRKIVPKRPNVSPNPTPLSELPIEIDATYEEGPAALTPDQYVKALAPANAAQKEISPLRTAGNIMQMWSSFVGSEELARKHSALSGFFLLTELQQVVRPDPDGSKLAQYLTDPPEDMLGDTPDERAQLGKALLHAHDVIGDARVTAYTVAESAFIIVSTIPEAVGGREAAHEQVAGLFHHPRIMGKLSGTDGLRTMQIERLAGTIIDRLATMGRYDIVNESRAIYKALQDPRLPITALHEILRGRQPSQAIQQEQHRYNAGVVAAAMREVVDGRGLTDYEKYFIRRFTGTDVLGSTKIKDIIFSVQKVTRKFEAVDDLIKRLGAPDKNYEGDTTAAIARLNRVKDNVANRRTSELATNMSNLEKAIDEITAALDGIPPSLPERELRTATPAEIIAEDLTVDEVSIPISPEVHPLFVPNQEYTQNLISGSLDMLKAARAALLRGDIDMTDEMRAVLAQSEILIADLLRRDREDRD